MSKYEPLARMLSQASVDEYDLSFAELEETLGFALPPSAREHRPWWANGQRTGHSQASGWVSVGWETRDIDLKRERVRFVRVKPSPRGDTGNGARDIWAEARAVTGVDDRAELERLAVRALIQQAAAQQLARLGGSMPDAAAAGRERRRT